MEQAVIMKAEGTWRSAMEKLFPDPLRKATCASTVLRSGGVRNAKPNEL